MQGLTRKGEYGIRGMLYLAGRPAGSVTMVGDVAAAMDVPVKFLAKIFQGLAKLGLVRSVRGVGGGFTLARPAAEISLCQVVEAIDGPIRMNVCLEGKGICDREGICAVHRVWRSVQDETRRILDSTTLAQLGEAESFERTPGRTRPKNEKGRKA
jgi:Rrf2 family protein